MFQETKIHTKSTTKSSSQEENLQAKGTKNKPATINEDLQGPVLDSLELPSEAEDNGFKLVDYSRKRQLLQRSPMTVAGNNISPCTLKKQPMKGRIQEAQPQTTETEIGNADREEEKNVPFPNDNMNSLTHLTDIPFSWTQQDPEGHSDEEDPSLIIDTKTKEVL